MRVFTVLFLFFLHFNFWAAQHGAVATVDPIATDAAIAAMKQGGRKQVGSGYYIHVSPQQVYLAGGIWHPDMDTLASIRDFIVAWPNKFEKVVLDKSFLKTFDGLGGDQLKTAPRGFPKDHPQIQWLRHKDHIVSHQVEPKEILSEKFIKKAGKIYEKMLPLNQFIKEAIS